MKLKLNATLDYSPRLNTAKNKQNIKQTTMTHTLAFTVKNAFLSKTNYNNNNDDNDKTCYNSRIVMYHLHLYWFPVTLQPIDAIYLCIVEQHVNCISSERPL